MAENSYMLPLGTVATDFNLPDIVEGKNKSLDDVRGAKGTVVMFICNHCPYVKHVEPMILEMAGKYQDLGVGFVAISSNDIENYPEDAPEKMKELALHHQYSFPYLYDESQEVARAYDAACTPDFYLFDENNLLVYRGRLDDSNPKNGKPLTGKDLGDAIQALLNQEKINQNQLPSIGCSIKWKN